MALLGVLCGLGTDSSNVTTPQRANGVVTMTMTMTMAALWQAAVIQNTTCVSLDNITIHRCDMSSKTVSSSIIIINKKWSVPMYIDGPSGTLFSLKSTGRLLGVG